MTLGFHIGFLEISLVDIIDIILVSVLLYQVYKLMRGSVALKVFLGFLSLYLIFLVVKAVRMELLTEILGQFMGVGVIAVIILFQPEIRKFLMLIGRTTAFNRENLFKRLFGKDTQDFQPLNLTAVIDAVKSLGGSNNGALIVFSRNTPLKFYAESGDELDAVISKRLLLSIFNKTSPLHDGAVIIYQGKIKAARCILPVSEQDNLPAQYGLRHRAALGMSEATDTLILVVSEETGQMSLVQNGKLKPNLSTMEIRDKIKSYYLEDKPGNIFSQAKDPDIQTKDSDPELAEA